MVTRSSKPEGLITRNFGNMDKNELDELKQKYLGRKVYAGGELKGYYGTIIDIVPDEDDIFDPWFIVRNDNYPSETGRWGKCELKKIIVTTKLVPLD